MSIHTIKLNDESEKIKTSYEIYQGLDIGEGILDAPSARQIKKFVKDFVYAKHKRKCK